MHTTPEVIDNILRVVAASSLAAEATGRVYPVGRPSPSSREDIVVNVAYNGDTGRGIWTATAYLRIYVPDTSKEAKYTHDPHDPLPASVRQTPAYQRARLLCALARQDLEVVNDARRGYRMVITSTAIERQPVGGFVVIITLQYNHLQ